MYENKSAVRSPQSAVRSPQPRARNVVAILAAIVLYAGAGVPAPAFAASTAPSGISTEILATFAKILQTFQSFLASQKSASIPPHADISPQVAAGGTFFPRIVGADGALYNFPATTRIDQLTNTSINTPTISGGNISGASIAGYLPLSGGTLTGALTGTALTLSGNLTVSGAQTLSGAITIPYLSATSSTASSFIQASTTRFSVFDKAYFGGTATTTIDSAGNLAVAGTLNVTGASTLGSLSAGNTTLANATSTSFAITNITSALPLANSSGSLSAYAGSSCTNQFVRSVNGAGVATCASVSLTADVTGILPIANGGTATSTQVTNGVNYFDSTKITSGTALTFDGTTLTAPRGAFSSTSGTTTIASGQGFTIGGSQFVLQQGSGFVGIGTTTPQNTLAVQGGLDLYRSSGAIINFKSTLKTLNFGTDSSGAFVLNDATAGISRLYLTSVGAMGIGNYFGPSNLPVNSFDVAGAASIGFGIGGAITAPSNGLLVSGNVGIGTTTPSRVLTAFSSAGPQLSLSTGAGSNEWTFRNAGGILYIATSTYSATSSVSAFTLDANGNLTIVGSATTCTIGNGTAATNCSSSDQRLKDDITSLATTSGLAAINALNPVSFRWNPWMQAMGNAGSTQFGLIAQEVRSVFPNLVQEDPNTHYYKLDYQGLIAPIVKAIQEIASVSGGFKDALVAWLGDAGNGIDKLFAHEIVATNGDFHQVVSDKICLRDTSGTSCYTRSQLDAALGVAASGGEGAGGDSSPAGGGVSSGATASTTAPVISINGANPAVIHVGDTYADLGARITGPQAALNLGIATFLDGAKVDQIQIDTSSTSTSTIDYVVTDSFGQIATATRVVIVE